jgi:hypothetical protein
MKNDELLGSPFICFPLWMMLAGEKRKAAAASASASTSAAQM